MLTFSTASFFHPVDFLLYQKQNLLIYLNRDVQQRIFQLFRYALGNTGYLFLGGSESAEQAQELFDPLHKRQRIYRTRPGKPPLPHLPVTLATAGQPTTQQPRRAKEGEPAPPSALGHLHQTLMLQRYAPPSVLVDRNYQIRYKFGDIGRYLRHQEGVPTFNLLDNISPQIRVELRTGLFTAFRQQTAIRPRQVQLDFNGHTEVLLLRIEPVPAAAQPPEELVLVIFEPLPQPAGAEGEHKQTTGEEPTVVQQLETELQELRHRMQTTVEEYETSNEELRSSNEELQSMNEELRSTTEELETSREELRSTSEELQSMNLELKAKIDALNRANSDLENLIEATNIATLFLDRELCLQRYTPIATDLFHLIPSDRGRPFSHIAHKIDHGTLPGLAAEVLKTLEIKEEEVQTAEGRWFLLQMRPYRTVADRIEGVVITLIDITNQREAETLAETRATQQAVVAELGMIALRGYPLEELLEMAVRHVATTLDIEYAKVLQDLPDEKGLRLIAGVGWQAGLVGQATVDGGTDSQAGFTLHSNQPVIVDDLRTEKRFQGPALLLDHGVVSGMSVVIQQRQGPFGVLGAHSRQSRSFTQQDTAFLQGVANVLSAAIERQQAETERTTLLEHVQAERSRLATILQQMPAAVMIAEAPSGRLVLENDQVETIWRRPYQQAQSITDDTHYPGFFSDGTPLAPEDWPLARTIRTGEVITGEEIVIERGDGTQGVITNSAAPILDEAGQIVAGVVIFQDVTERKRTEAERDRLVQELRELTESLELRVAQRTEELRQRSEQLSVMASALTVAEQRERERVSQILHDDLQQLIYATQMRVLLLEADLDDNVETERIRAGLLEVNGLYEQALTIVRTLTVELSPPLLENQLVEALEWLASHMTNSYGLQITIAGDRDAELANRDLRELAFQIVRELLFNVVKHAGVEEASVHLCQEAQECVITVADQGQGFEVTLVEERQASGIGYGLPSIRERVALFEGSLTIETAPGAGTRISVRLPGQVAEEQDGNEEIDRGEAFRSGGSSGLS